MTIGYRVVHVGFGFAAGAEPVSELEKLFARVAAEWTRYDGHCWLLYSNRSLESLGESIRESVGQAEFLLCEMEPGSYTGCLRDGVAQWLQRVS